MFISNSFAFLQLLVVFTYLIATGFTSVYHMSVDTIFICASKCIHTITSFHLAHCTPPPPHTHTHTHIIPPTHTYSIHPTHTQWRISSETMVKTSRILWARSWWNCYMQRTRRTRKIRAGMHLMEMEKKSLSWTKMYMFERTKFF